jgi:integrase
MGRPGVGTPEEEEDGELLLEDIAVPDLGDPENLAEVDPHRCPVFLPEGVDDAVVQVLCGGWSRSRTKAIKSAWNLWAKWCETRRVDALRAGPEHLVNFLNEKLKGNRYGCKWFTNLASAISTKLSLLQGRRIGQLPLVVAFLRSIKKLRPAKPRYAETFDPAPLLALMRKKGENKTLSRPWLVGKIVTLLYLTGLRAGDQAQIRLSLCRLDEPRHDMILQTHVKQGHGEWVGHRVQGLPAEPMVCPHCAVKELVSRRPKRTAKPVDDSLFLHEKTHKSLSAQWLSKCASTLMREAGIPEQFKPHALRGAGATKLLEEHVPEATVRRLFGWTAKSPVLDRHYNRAEPETAPLEDMLPEEEEE